MSTFSEVETHSDDQGVKKIIRFLEKKFHDAYQLSSNRIQEFGFGDD